MPVYGRNTLRPLDKRGISSVMLGKQLGISQKRAWCLSQKLRKAMGEREAQGAMYCAPGRSDLRPMRHRGCQLPYLDLCGYCRQVAHLSKRQAGGHVGLPE